MSSNKLEENQSISLTCHADVGSPQGYVQILKIPEYSNTSEVIYTSNTTNIRTENCTEYINVTTTYTVTREDNGAVFRCSSQNGLTQGLGPNMTSSKITVICMYKIYLRKKIYFEIKDNTLKIMFIIVCCRKKSWVSQNALKYCHIILVGKLIKNFFCLNNVLETAKTCYERGMYIL